MKLSHAFLKIKKFFCRMNSGLPKQALYWVLGSEGSGKKTWLKKNNLFQKSHEKINLYQNKENQGCFHYIPGPVFSSEKKWECFLKSVTGWRYRFFSRGVFIVISIKSFLQFNWEDREVLSDTLESRLESLFKKLGKNLPIFFVLTKLDEIKGFESFFSEHEKIPKIGLENWHSRTIELDFKNLFQRLKTWQESDITSHCFDDNACLGYPFPRHFLLFSSALKRFLLTMNENPRFFSCGVVFISHQKIKPDQIDSKISDFNFPLLPFHQKWSGASEKKYWMLRSLSFLPSLLLFLSLFLCINHGFQWQKKNILSGERSIKASSLSPKSVLKAVQFYRLQNSEDFLGWKRWMFFPGVSKKIWSDYLRKSLEKSVGEPLKKILRKKLLHFQKNWNLLSLVERKSQRGDYLLQVALYQYLFDGDKKSLENENEFFAKYLKEKNGGQLEDWLLLVKTYFSFHQKEPMPLGERQFLNRSKQQRLTLDPLQDEFDLILSEANQKYQNLSFSKLVGSKYQTFFSKEQTFPKAYTKEAWRHFLSSRFRRGVLNKNLSSSDQALVLERWRKNYEVDSEKHWISFLNNLQPKFYPNLDQAAMALQSWMAIDGPLMSLLKNYNEYQITHKTTQVIQRVELLKNYRKALRALKEDLSSLSVSPNIGLSSQNYAREILGSSLQRQRRVLYQAYLSTKQMPMSENPALQKAWERVFQLPVKMAWHSILRETDHWIQQQWQDQVWPDYLSVMNNYPFSYYGRDADVSSVSRLFSSSQGSFGNFFNEALSHFVEPKKSCWSVRRWLDQGVMLSNRFLCQIPKWQHVGRFLKHDIQRQGETKLAVYPKPALGIESMRLVFDTQNCQYRNGPQHWCILPWRYRFEEGEAWLEITEEGQSAHDVFHFTGPWAWLRLLSRGNLQYLGEGHYRCRWSIRGHQSITWLLHLPTDPQALAVLLRPPKLPRVIVVNEHV